MVGLICLTAVGVYWSSPAILGPSTSLPTVDVATKIHKHPLCKGTMLPPSLLVDIANSDDARSALSGLKYVNWLGGQLPSHVMKLLKAHVNIYSSFGATEFGNIPLNIESQDNAGYYSFSKLAGATFRRYQGTNGEAAAKDPDTEPLFELVLERQPSIVSAQLIFLNNPKLQQYATKDLFSAQPDKPYLWRYRGRTDDMINTAHGQLIDPTLQENTVGANPAVSCALLVGTNRKAPAWLIELRVQADGDSEKAALKERIWESVQRANELAPNYARVKKGKILFTKPDKPMLRASKGTMQRNATIEAYKEEIDQLYKSRPSSVSW
jgi:acyl-coenzyme A synthetase/AMP-(fatty) acid ligase